MNSEIVKGILLFLAGGAVGGGTAAFVFKKKIDDLEESYEDRLNEEIEEVRAGIEESYQERMERTNYELYEENDGEDSEVDTEKLAEISKKIVDSANKAREKPDLMTYKDHIHKEKYVSYSGKKDNSPDKNPTFDEDSIEPLEAMRDDIEIIAPDEFGEIRDYEQVNLYLLRDEVLVDDEGRPVENVLATVGPDALENIGVYESDSVYVRNHAQETDYAIFMRDETLNNFSL